MGCPIRDKAKELGIHLNDSEVREVKDRIVFELSQFSLIGKLGWTVQRSPNLSIQEISRGYAREGLVAVITDFKIAFNECRGRWIYELEGDIVKSYAFDPSPEFGMDRWDAIIKPERIRNIYTCEEAKRLLGLI